MTRWGEVSYRVRRAIAFHERFTISQLADSTGLTYEQVEQVVHRLVNRGDVRRLSPEELTGAEQEVERQAGRPRARYMLTDDPIRRAEFVADLEALAAAARLQLAPARRPDTPYYTAALQIIEAMESGEERVQLARLREAEGLLVYGREYEALVPEGLEVVQAYYDLAMARLKVLGSEFLAAERLLDQAGQSLVRAGLDEEAGQVAERRLALKMERELSTVEQALTAGRDALPGLERLHRVVLDAPWSPLLPALGRAIELLKNLVVLGPEARTAVSELLIGFRAEARSRQQHRRQQEELLARVTRMEHAIERRAPKLQPPSRELEGRSGELGRELGGSLTTEPPLAD